MAPDIARKRSHSAGPPTTTYAWSRCTKASLRRWREIGSSSEGCSAKARLCSSTACSRCSHIPVLDTTTSSSDTVSDGDAKGCISWEVCLKQPALFAHSKGPGPWRAFCSTAAASHREPGRTWRSITMLSTTRWSRCKLARNLDKAGACSVRGGCDCWSSNCLWGQLLFEFQNGSPYRMQLTSGSDKASCPTEFSQV